MLRLHHCDIGLFVLVCHISDHAMQVFKSTAELRPQSGIAERQASLAARLVPAAVSGRASYEASDRSMAAAAVAGSGADDAAADTGSGHGEPIVPALHLLPCYPDHRTQTAVSALGVMSAMARISVFELVCYRAGWHRHERAGHGALYHRAGAPCCCARCTAASSVLPSAQSDERCIRHAFWRRLANQPDAVRTGVQGNETQGT